VLFIKLQSYNKFEERAKRNDENEKLLKGFITF